LEKLYNLYSKVKETISKWKDIAWTDVSFSVGSKKILTTCWGSVAAGQTCAIMGPSGAGKSSLLNVLAGRSASGGGNVITGTVSRKNIFTAV
jgi:ABC-type multidrug transport system ATPase subunit